MQSNYKYSLDKSSKKHLCPQCNKRRFTLYIDKETNEPLPAKYGKCDRVDACNYHLNPYKDGYAKEQLTGYKHLIEWKTKPKAKPIYFDLEAFKQTLNPERYKFNTFIQNLLKTVKFPFDSEDITKVIELYYLGTVAKGYLAGANAFPFIDINGNIRAVQVKQFDNTNHTTKTNWLDWIINKHHAQNNKPLPVWLQAYNNNEGKGLCLFGEHLLSKYPNNPIALVEAPKTAIYGALYLGQPEHPKNFIWLAVFNKGSFSFDKLKVLKGRDVFVFPDLSKDGNTFKEWETKAKEYQKLLSGTRFKFSELLENLATPEQKEKGADIADILINLDWRLFRKAQPEVKPRIIETIEPVKVAPEPFELIMLKTELSETVKEEQPENWDKEIEELETYFKSIEIPGETIKLNKGTTIVDGPKFISAHLVIIKANNGKKRFTPYLNRLQELKNTLK